MKKINHYSGLMAIIASNQKISANQIAARAERLENNAADSAALARKFRKESGLLEKSEARIFKKQAKLLEKQAQADQMQADLYRQHLKLSKKFN